MCLEYKKIKNEDDIKIENIRLRNKYLENNNAKLLFELERINDELISVQNLLDARTKYYNEKLSKINKCKNNYEFEIKKLKNICQEDDKRKKENELILENFDNKVKSLENYNRKLLFKLENIDESLNEN